MMFSVSQLMHLQGERAVLEQIVPMAGREAVEQGLLYVHALSHYTEPEVVVPNLLAAAALAAPCHVFRLLELLKRYAGRPTTQVLDTFAADVGYRWRQLWPEQDRGPALKALFGFAQTHPRVHMNLNLGDDREPELVEFTRAVLDVLDSGATLIEPQVVFRVRRGVNFEPGSPNHRLLLQALEIARTRLGVAFAFLDSPLNVTCSGLVAFTAMGLRVEPWTLDFYTGNRGVALPARVSINIPLALSYGTQCLEQNVDVAARILAHRLELMGALYQERSLPLVINCAFLQNLDSSDTVFEVLQALTRRVRELSREYSLRFVLSSTADLVSFMGTSAAHSRTMSAVLAASMDPYLPGGHCFTLGGGAHLTRQELYEQLVHAEHAGVSFVRFLVDDIRCAQCHLSVAAAGSCPACGSVERRRISESGAHLVEGK